MRRLLLDRQSTGSVPPAFLPLHRRERRVRWSRSGRQTCRRCFAESHREAEPLGEAELDIADRSLADLDPRRHTLVATRQHRRGWPFDQLSNTETLLAPSPADRRQLT